VRPLLFNFGSSDDLLRQIADQVAGEVGTVDRRIFPDGETYLRFDNECKGRPVMVACSLDRPDKKLLPLLLGADTLHDLGASHVGLIAPYLAYMRQDKQFSDGEGITARYFADILGAHFDWLITVDPHLHRFRTLDEIYSIPAFALHAAPLLAEWICANVLRPIIIGPDRESEQWVAEVALGARCPYTILEKVRSGDRDVRVSVPELNGYRDRTPVLVDDIISTGHTMIATLEHLTRMGAPAAVCVAVHGVFAKGALSALHKAGALAIVTCNTIEHPSNGIDTTKIIAAAARDIVAA
jgi:ribose-phosphate pyrophosphokinase